MWLPPFGWGGFSMERIFCLAPSSVPVCALGHLPPEGEGGETSVEHRKAKNPSGRNKIQSIFLLASPGAVRSAIP